MKKGDPFLILKRERDAEGRERETFIGQTPTEERAEEIAKDILRRNTGQKKFGKKNLAKKHTTPTPNSAPINQMADRFRWISF